MQHNLEEFLSGFCRAALLPQYCLYSVFRKRNRMELKNSYSNMIKWIFYVFCVVIHPVRGGKSGRICERVLEEKAAFLYNKYL